jgi:hypothetical protein
VSPFSLVKVSNWLKNWDFSALSIFLLELSQRTYCASNVATEGAFFLDEDDDDEDDDEEEDDEDDNDDRLNANEIDKLF